MSGAAQASPSSRLAVSDPEAGGGRGAPVLVSVIVKALNEERNIERALRSALQAVAAAGGGEVILSDSLSTDRTVELARALPVRIVQLTDAADRSCGVGAQLGIQVARGEFVYILDGDMELDAGLLPTALACLRADPGLAGVAGLVEEMNLDNQAFAGRKRRGTTSTPADDVLCLDMGGLYRRAAIEAVGYFTNRNLHAYEEFELGARLVRAGWRLRRIGVPGVRHYGYTCNSLALLVRRWRSRYAWGHGELLRAALGRAHASLVLRHLRLYRIAVAVILLWATTLGASLAAGLSPPLAVAAAVVAWLVAWVAMAVRKRSIAGATYSIVSWHVGALGLIRGLVSAPRFDPSAPVAYRLVQ